MAFCNFLLISRKNYFTFLILIVTDVIDDLRDPVSVWLEDFFLLLVLLLDFLGFLFEVLKMFLLGF